MCSLKECALITLVALLLLVFEVKSLPGYKDGGNIASSFIPTKPARLEGQLYPNNHHERIDYSSREILSPKMCKGWYGRFHFRESGQGLNLRGGCNSHSVDIDQTTRDRIVTALMDMGATRQRAEAVSVLSGAFDAEDAMQWMIEHLDDPRIDMPIESQEHNQPSRMED